MICEIIWIVFFCIGGAPETHKLPSHPALYFPPGVPSLSRLTYLEIIKAVVRRGRWLAESKTNMKFSCVTRPSETLTTFEIWRAATSSQTLEPQASPIRRQYQRRAIICLACGRPTLSTQGCKQYSCNET